MNSSNKPNESLNQMNWASGNREWLAELFHDVIGNKIQWEDANEVALLDLLKNNPGRLVQEVRDDMVTRWIRNPSNYENLTEEDIRNNSKLSERLILDTARMMLLKTTTDQEKLQKKVQWLFVKETFADTPEGNENKRLLLEWVQGKNERDIEKLLKSPTTLVKRLQQECYGEKMNAFMRTSSISFFEELGIKSETLSKDEKEAINRIFWSAGAASRPLEGIWAWADYYDIRKLLQIIDDAPAETARKLEVKKELIREHMPMIAPKFLVELWVIDEGVAKDKIRTALKTRFGNDFFSSGDQSERNERQKLVDNLYNSSSTIELPIEDYLNNENFINELFDKSKTSNTAFTRAVEDSIRDARAQIYNSRLSVDDYTISPDVNGKWHSGFIEQSAALRNNKNGKKITNVEKMLAGAFLVITDNEGKQRYYRINQTDVEMPDIIEGMRDKNGLPMKHHGMILEDWTRNGGMAPAGARVGMDTKGYTEMFSMFQYPKVEKIEVLTEDEIDERRKQRPDESWYISTEYTADDTITSQETLTEKLWWTPTVGKLYQTKEISGGGKIHFSIKTINDTTKNITVSDGIKDFTLSYGEFYVFAAEHKVEELWSIDTEWEIQAILQKMDGYEDFLIEDGKIQYKKKDGKKIVIKHLLDEDGEWVQVKSIWPDGVTVRGGKVKIEGEWADIQGKARVKDFRWSEQTLSIPAFLTMINDEGHKPYIDPEWEATELESEENLPHEHGSFWGKWMNYMSINDMRKGFDIVVHAIQHKFEKNGKFQSAKFANDYLGKFLPKTFQYQVRAEAYAAQNEALEGILKMLENDMSGKEARKYVREKILLNKDAKFEEVLAGLLYISKKTGQLYPEELSDLKESNIWFNKLARTQGYRNKTDRARLWQKMLEKTDKSAKDNEWANEADIIERLLKYYEWQEVRIPPNIAPRFVGAIKEWVSSNKEKWEQEVSTRTNIKQLNKYALSKLAVGEGYKTIGAIDRIFDKNGGPVDLNKIPFTMVMSNMPEYLGSEYRKMMHSEATGKLRNTHAFMFGNELEFVRNYRNVVALAAKEADRRSGTTEISKALAEIEADRKKVGYDSHDPKEPDKFQKEWITSIYNFWGKYGDKIHPILMMTDTFVGAKADAWDEECRKYKQRFEMISGMQNGQVENIYKSPAVGEWNLTPNHSPFHFTNLVNASFNAINTHDGSMTRDPNAYGKIFKSGVLGSLQELKKLDESKIPPWLDLETVRYKRFREYYAALVYYMRPKSWERIGEQTYMQNLRNIGLQFEKSDFRKTSSTTPAWAELKWDNSFSALHLDAIDEIRCKTMYQSFMSSRSRDTVNSRTSEIIDFGNYWS